MKTWSGLLKSSLLATLLIGPTQPTLGLIIVDEEVVDERRRLPGVRVPRPIHRFAPLEMRSHGIQVNIDDQIAVTSIEQVYYNASSRRLEGTFLFPLPAGADIQKFAMDVNGQMMAAELLDAKKARGIYEDIVRRCKDPALMEYAGQSLLKVRIFPIEPNQEKRVKLKYTELLKREGNMVGYTFPLNTSKHASRPIGSLGFKADIKTKHRLKTIYSPSHDLEINRKNDRKAVAGFEAEQVIPDVDLKLFFATDTPDGEPIGLDVLTHKASSEEEGYFLMLLSPGVWDVDGEVVEKDVVFVLDTSGSMRGKKLAQAKAALAFCLEGLNPGDRFEVIRYSTETEAIFEGLVPADTKRKEEAQAFVKDLKALGGTAIEGALLEAVSMADDRSEIDRPYQVIFLTDGRPTIGETHPDRILARLGKALEPIEGTVRVFSFGIGTNVNTKLLDRVSEDTRATSEYVLPDEDIEIKVSRLYSKISEPVLAGLKLKFDGSVRTKMLYPNVLPDLFKGDQLVVLGRYDRKESGAKPSIRLTGSVNGRKESFEFKAKFPRRHQKNGFIPRLWANRRVGYLLDEIRLRGDHKELREEIVMLARTHGIVTPYTSYLIVEDEESRAVPLARQSMGRRLSEFSRGRVDRPEGLTESQSRLTRRFGVAPLSAAAAPELQQLRKEEADSFFSLQSDASGDKAVANARANALLKNADKLDASNLAWRAAQFGAVYRAKQQQPTRMLGGKTFYQNGSEWIDSALQAKSEAKVVKVKFNSKEYFDLLAKDTKTAQWLSVGSNLRLLVGNVIYQIEE